MHVHLELYNTKIVNLNFNPSTLFAFCVIAIAMAFQMPAFVSRLMRPFSTSMSRPLTPDSLAQISFDVPTERAIYAGGCFWGLEELYRRDWGRGKGLLDCRVGYTGGETEHPDYDSVCSGRTGHAESLLVVYDPKKVSYSQLTEYFFKMHDPTQLNGQGNDIGTQYRSAVFAENEEQLKIANEIKDKVGQQWYKGQPITTQILMAGQWYDAEPKHQDYLTKHSWGYKCPAHRVRSHLPPLA